MLLSELQTWLARVKTVLRMTTVRKFCVRSITRTVATAIADQSHICQRCANTDVSNFDIKGLHHNGTQFASEA